MLFCIDEKHTHPYCTFIRDATWRGWGGANERDAWTNYALRYFFHCRCCCYAITDRCPIHLGILSACDWQPNNNNQSFENCAVQSALRHFQTTNSILHNKCSIQFHSRILTPNWTRLQYKKTHRRTVHFWAWEKHSIMLIYNSCNCFGYRILNFWQRIWQCFSAISGHCTHIVQRQRDFCDVHDFECFQSVHEMERNGMELAQWKKSRYVSLVHTHLPIS